MYYGERRPKLRQFKYGVERFFQKILFWSKFWITLPWEFAKHLKSDEWKEEMDEINKRIDEKWTPERKKSWNYGFFVGAFTGTFFTLYSFWLAMRIFIK